jgi:hypothetical protein
MCRLYAQRSLSWRSSLGTRCLAFPFRLQASQLEINMNGNNKMVRIDGGSRLEMACSARLRPAGCAAAAFATIGLAEPKQAKPAKAGGARRDRTADLVIANDALSQLSYGPLRGRLDACEGGQQSAPFTIRAKVESRTAKSPFPPRLARNFPCLPRGEPISSSQQTPRVHPPCVPFSTSFSSFSISMSGS